MIYDILACFRRPLLVVCTVQQLDLRALKATDVSSKVSYQGD